MTSAGSDTTVAASELDAEALYQKLRQGVERLCGPDTRLVGITSGGAWLAERLQSDLGRPGACGVISSTMHRDDFAQRGLSQRAATKLPFDVNGAHIIVLDDVLYTGRTIRAVINELFDFGRPARVQLAVLVDRGGRELPIQADVVAAHVPVAPPRTLALRRDASGAFVLALEERR